MLVDQGAAGPMNGTAELPPGPGAYALLIETDAAVSVRVRGVLARLPPGCYLYCGSAFGPGGIRARVARHLRKRKPNHWHVDGLTAIGRVRAVVVAPGGRECELFARFSALAGSDIPVPGFGASDCRTCPAHLFSLASPRFAADALPILGSEMLVMMED